MCSSACTAGFRFMDTFLRIGEKRGRCESAYCWFLIFLKSFLLPYFLLSIEVWTASHKYFLKVFRKFLEVVYCILVFRRIYFPYYGGGNGPIFDRNCILFNQPLKHDAKMLYSFSVGLSNFLLTIFVNPLIWFFFCFSQKTKWWEAHAEGVLDSG